MSKGDETRAAIVSHALAVASREGLEGLSIGGLARDLGLSKSGLFAHFQSKEALQVQVLEAASQRFVDEVIRPALAQPRGEPRVRALFERWLGWGRSRRLPGGCVFVAAAAELDDRPGPVRDRLVSLQRDWLDVIAQTVRAAVAEGAFRDGVDAEQFAHDVYGAMLAYHHAARLLDDPRAEARLRHAFDALLAGVRA